MWPLGLLFWGRWAKFYTKPIFLWGKSIQDPFFWGGGEGGVYVTTPVLGIMLVMCEECDTCKYTISDGCHSEKASFGQKRYNRA
jgi:hypothetical protein